MKLSAYDTHDVFTKCLFKEDEPKDNPVIVEGVMMKIGFHPGRLKENEGKVIAFLDELPDNFKEGIGGGWSFLNACNDKDGDQWADMHQTMDELICLGIAIKAVRFQVPRSMWGMFPGGMPYFVVLHKVDAVHGSIVNVDAE